jgi:hypothetical protein
MLNRLHPFGLSAVLALLVMSGALAQGVTQAFTYQGFLRQGGAPLTNPSQQMTFRIYDALTGGTLLWNSGVLTVNVNNGLFTVQLNAPASVWTGAERFLEIQVGATTLSPRVRLNPTPYANTSTLLNMFQSGNSNPDRMVITHSPAFANWGLQYRDSDDSFHFLGSGVSRLSINLGTGVLQYPLGAAAGRVLTSDASGNASWQALPGGATAWTVSGADIYNANSGNVGIGTNSPTQKLQVSGGMLVDSSTGSLRIGYPASANQWYFSTIGGGANLQLWENAANAIRMFFEAGGNIGVGTNDPAYLFDVLGDRNARLMNITNTNTGGAADGLYISVSGSTGWGLNSTASGSDGVAVRGVATGTNAWAGFFLGRGHFSGNVGIGTSSLMTARLNVAVDSTTDNATLRLHETAADFARLEFTNTNTARKWHIAGLIGTAVANDRLNFWNSAVGDIMSIRGDGTVSVRVLEITGADLAEKFPTTDTVEPGMVVEIDPDNPGHLRKAQGAYNKRVVGVVAGANGLSKGIILGNLEGSENHSPIAMSGRVWVYADATERAIEPGDFLTTAEKPGYAMAVDNLAQAQGAIIGKAMTRLEKGKTGMVLVVVNLQ